MEVSPMRVKTQVLVLSALFLLCGCAPSGTQDSDAGDAGEVSDGSSMDASTPDGSQDAGNDSGPVDGGLDTDAADGSEDAGDDAGEDTGFDAGFDAGAPDSGVDWDSSFCRTVAPDAGLSAPYYVNRSRETGLQKNVDAGYAGSIAGNRMMAVDLDNDFYPDLIVHRVSGNVRDDPTASPPVRNKYILMNRFMYGMGFQDSTSISKYGIRRDDGSQLNRVAHLAVAADVDNDGTLDLFSGTYTDLDPLNDPGDRSEILLNNGKGVFTLASESPIYRDWGQVTSATFLDYDRDGCIDLFVGAFYISWTLNCLPDRLFKGDCKGSFTDVTEEMGLMTDDSKYPDNWENGTASKPTYGVSSCDIDGDGNHDILTSTYGRQWNNLWWRNGDKFQEIGRMVGYAGDALLDYTDNEYYKCYCVDNPGTCTPDPGTPRIYCHDPKTGDPLYSWEPGVDDQPWRLNGNTFTTICADINNDLRPDVLPTEIRHWHIGQSSDPTQILMNMETDSIYGFTLNRIDNKTNGMYRTWTNVDWNEGDISGAIFDFDNDGLPDIFLATSDYPKDRDFMFHQKPDGTFEEIAKIIGVAHVEGQEVTVADFDRDGDLDIVVGTSLARWSGGGKPPDALVYYYENQIGDRKNSIEIKLVGGGKAGLANKAAIGARVIVTTYDGRKQMREVDGGHGHFGLQNDLVLHFGLESECLVKEIEIRWPDKDLTVEKFQDVRANWLVEIEQGAGKVKYAMPFPKKS
jgi:hypothetical protein